MDTHITLEKEKTETRLSSPTSRSLSQLSNVDRTLKGIVTERCAHIDTTIDYMQFHDILPLLHH